MFLNLSRSQAERALPRSFHEPSASLRQRCLFSCFHETSANLLPASQKQINTPLNADHPEMPTITLGWSLEHARCILKHSVLSFGCMVSRAGWHRNRGVCCLFPSFREHSASSRHLSGDVPQQFQPRGRRRQHPLRRFYRGLFLSHCPTEGVR